MGSSLQARIYRQVEKFPERRAWAFIDRDGKFSWRSLAEVYRDALAYSSSLARLGVRRGDVCLLVLPNEEFSAVTLLAVLFRGAIPMFAAPPVIQKQGTHSSLAEILKRVIGKTKPRIVVAPEEMSEIRSEFGGISRHTTFIFGRSGLTPDASSTEPVVTPAANALAALQLSSGTTGLPRICVWHQEQVLATIDSMYLAMDMTDDDICLNWTPLYHDMGLVNNFFLCLSRGVPLVMLNPLDFIRRPELWLRGLSESGATITWSPNFGFVLAAERVRDEEVRGIRLDRVRAFWNAAERIHLQTFDAFYQKFARFGLRKDALKTAYGLAENVGAVAFSDPHGTFLTEQVDEEILRTRGRAHPAVQPSEGQKTRLVIGVGRPCPGIHMTIVSPKGRLLPDGWVGEVVLKTPSCMTGYLGDARGTKRAIQGQALHTGDLGYLRGNELFWVGRMRERINVRGQKIDPSDFEQILWQVPALRQGCFAAFGVDDEKVGTERVVIAAEVKDPILFDLNDVSSLIRRLTLLRLGLNVDEIILVRPGTLTKTSSGKRRHRYFRRLYMDGKLKDFEVSPVEARVQASESAPPAAVRER